MKHTIAGEKVQEFRQITEHVIKNAESRQVGRPIRHGSYNTHAGGLIFTIIAERDARDVRFGSRQERLWGVASETTTQIAGNLGSLVLLSSEDMPNSLIRRVHFNTGMMGVATERIMVDDELTTAVGWVKSPHLETDSFSSLNQLLPDELVAVNDQFQEEAVWAQELRDELKAIDKAMRPGPDYLIG